MKKLLVVWSSFFVFVLSLGTALAQIEYLIDGENPASVYENHPVTITLDPAGIINTSLITAGCLIAYDYSNILITNVVAADSDVGGPWDPGFTSLVPNADGPGTYWVIVGNWDTVPVDDPIPICDLEFDCMGLCYNSPIIILTIPGFDTVVGDTTLWDFQITGGIIEPQAVHPCLCLLDGPINVCSDPLVEVAAQYTGSISSGSNCDNPPNYVWFDDCALGNVDQTGLLTVPPAIASETCTICFMDTANTNINTGGPIECCLPIEILVATVGVECEGNFDDDEDQDGSDAAVFKLDFGRSIFSNPCTNGNACNGDFDCDADVDGTDAAKFKEDFGRSPFSDPCPSCPADPGCTYP